MLWVRPRTSIELPGFSCFVSSATILARQPILLSRPVFQSGHRSAGFTNSGNAVTGLHPRRSSLFRALHWVWLGPWLFHITKPRWQVI
jgi:hypothetical protein